MRCRFLTLACAAIAAQAQTAIDFSYAGYGGRGVALPTVAAVVSVRPGGRDDGSQLQQAIDSVSAMTLNKDGFHGAIQLLAGRYRVAGRLQIKAAGVVLRGIGDAVIVATGSSRRTLLNIVGRAPATDAPVAITGEAVPAGSLTFGVTDTSPFHAGDRVVITRPSTVEWITALHMRGLPGTYANQRLDWAPGSRNLVWDRTIVQVDPATKRVTVDAPITTALERRYGGGTIARVNLDNAAGGIVAHIGIENLTFESEVAAGRPRDEDHAWTAIAIDNTEDVWVRKVKVRRFAGSAVRVGPRARRVTVDDSRSEQPVSELAGYRRQSFLVEGQQVLVRNCFSEQGMNDFATGLLAAGPNVFLNSTAEGSLGPSGSFESWASGVLYENVRIHGSGIRLTNDSSRAEGAGWTAANSVVWNSEGDKIEALGPEGAENIVQRSAAPLYEIQLVKRLGHRPEPSIPLAAAGRVPEFHTKTPSRPAEELRRVDIVNGRFVAAGKTLWGGMVNDGWWRGQEVPGSSLDVGGVALTRYVPGRTGPGLTEDLAALVARMAADGTPFYQSIPGLWYDRRRDEHSIVARPDGNVWAPFYEMPWARSGTGTAWDGLSKFDLSKFNPWYFERIVEFGALSDRNGFVLYHNLYNTHNVLEIPPHWIDYPWRPANNINDTGLPEPPPIQPGNQLHVGNEVYDITQPVRRELHRAFILHSLDELSGVRNIFLCLGFQFAGPLAFQEFFHDTVAEWEKRTGKTVRVELATSKDITDAILAAPARARQVAVIDMRYWQYRADGSLFAPAGGQNLAFRELIRKENPRFSDTPPDTTPQQVYRAVREYHDRYPDKAIVAWHGGAGPIPVLMAGGAQAIMQNPSGGHGQGRVLDRTTFDPFVREHLADVLMKMQPRDGVVADPDRNWCMADARRDAVLLYSLSGDSIQLRETLPKDNYTAVWFDPRTGKTQAAAGAVPHRAGDVVMKPSGEAWLLLLR
jgi:Family of unknown function (DUF6298)/Putative collagen-binding domain of a collagenase